MQRQDSKPQFPRVNLQAWRDRARPQGICGISSDHLVEQEGLTIAVVRLEPGAVVPPHRHEHSDEIFDVCEGRGEILIDGVWRPLEPGSTALVEAGALHALRNRTTEPCVLRETVRDRVYARAAILAAFRKRWNRFRTRQ